MERNNSHDMVLKLKGVELRNRNFRGQVNDYNDKGYRRTTIVIEEKHAYDCGFKSLEEMADVLHNDGFNLKLVTGGKDPSKTYIPRIYMDVQAIVGCNPNTGMPFNNQSKIFISTDKTTTLMTEQNIHEIDHADIESVNCNIVQRYWKYGNKTGYKNAIKSMEVFVREDHDDIVDRNMAMIAAMNNAPDDFSEEGVPF